LFQVGELKHLEDWVSTEGIGTPTTKMTCPSAFRVCSVA